MTGQNTNALIAASTGSQVKVSVRKQKQKQAPQQSQKSGLNVSNYFDTAVFEYVEDSAWPAIGLSNGKWLINGKSVTGILADIVLAPEAWVARKERGVFYAFAVEKHFRHVLRGERHWCKDFTLSPLRGLVEYVSSAIHCTTYRNTKGNEKEKFKAADAASAAYEKRFL